MNIIRNFLIAHYSYLSVFFLGLFFFLIHTHINACYVCIHKHIDVFLHDWAHIIPTILYATV